MICCGVCLLCSFCTILIVNVYCLLDMCPKPNVTTNALSRKSHVEDLPEPIMTLFYALVSEPDVQQRWESLTFPVDFDIEVFKPDFQKEIKILQSE